MEAGQKTEHYEIATYGSLCSWAEELGRSDVAALLSETLSEEKEADERLTMVAEAFPNVEATRHDTQKRSETGAKFSKMMGT